MLSGRLFSTLAASLSFFEELVPGDPMVYNIPNMVAGSCMGWASTEPLLGIPCTDAMVFITLCASIQEPACKSCLQKQARAVCKPSRLGLCLNLCD